MGKMKELAIEQMNEEEAKQIAGNIDGFINYGYAGECGFNLISEKDVLYKKKDDPVINPKTGEPFRKQKKKDDKDKKVQSKKITKSKVNKGKKKNAKKK